MNKIFKYSTLFLAVAATFVACKEEDNFTAGQWNAAADYADVYFPVTSQVIELDPTDDTEIKIEVARRNVANQLSVAFDVLNNDDNVFQVGTADFAAGDTTTTITVTFPKAEVGKTYSLRLSTADTRYVSQYSHSVEYNANVTRVKWNDVGFYYDERGQKVEGYAMYTEDCFTTFYGVENVSWPVRVQERDDRPGFFRVVNPYNDYAYNDPGDFDTDVNHYMLIDATKHNQVYIPEPFNTGTHWQYGYCWIYSMVGLGKDRGNSSYIEGNYGTYANGKITFPVDALLFAMDSYNGGGWYGSNGSGKFCLVLDPDADIYVADIAEDYDYADVFEGVFTSGKLKSTGTAKLQKGAPKAELQALLDAEKAVAPEETIYRIVEPYAEGYDIYFGVDKNGKIVVPDGFRLQPTGLDDNMGHDIYAKINSPECSFDEKLITLNMTFVSKDEALDYGTAVEKIANIKWNEYATGTFYYNMFSDVDGELTPDPGYKMYVRDDDASQCKIGEWLMGTDFVFTWNRETNECVVLEQEIQYEHPDYGAMYIIEGAEYNSDKYGENTSYFDPETKVFHFFPVYFVGAGSFGQVEELFELTEGGEVKRLTAPVWGSAKLNSMIRKANPWTAKKAVKMSPKTLRRNNLRAIL